MNNIFIFLLAVTWLMNSASAATPASHCLANETTLFTCTLTNKKIVSLCSTKKTPRDTGYLQYRFGVLGRVELAIPNKKSGIPVFALVHSKDKYTEYDKIAIVSEPLTYNIESYRQFKKLKDGYPTPKSNDSLTIEDSRKSVWEGNKVFTSNCSPLAAPLDIEIISKMTGIKAE